MRKEVLGEEVLPIVVAEQLERHEQGQVGASTEDEHRSVDSAAQDRLAPGVTWWGWRVPTPLELAIVVAMGVAILALAINRFSKTE